MSAEHQARAAGQLEHRAAQEVARQAAQEAQAAAATAALERSRAVGDPLRARAKLLASQGKS